MTTSNSARPDMRPGLCSVCNHPEQQQIDTALINGMSLRPLAALYGLSASALSRHSKHLRRALELQHHQDYQKRISDDLDELDLIRVRLERIFRQAEHSQSLHISLGCLQETVKLLALRNKIRHNLKRRY